MTEAAAAEPDRDTLVRWLANPSVLSLYNDVNACQSPVHLYAVAAVIWERWGAGAISDDEASYLAACVERRRPLSQRNSAGQFANIGKMAGVVSRFLPRRYRGSPDRKASRDRRRMLGGSSVLPDNLRHHYTEGQRSVLSIIAGEVKKHGVCDLPIDKIAALAGVCRTTVQNTMHEARRLQLIKITERPVRGRKSLPNLVNIVSAEWIAWIKRGPSASRRIGSNPVILVSTTKTKVRKKEEQRFGNGMGNGHGPPQYRRGAA